MSVWRAVAPAWVAASLLAACQPLPHPFADDKPSAALVAVPDNFDISIGSFAGAPRATATKLPAALARELLKRNIAASDRTTSRTSLQLDGRIEEHPDKARKSVVTVFLRLHDPSDHLILERSDRLAAPARDWAAGSDEPIAKLAAASADGLAERLLGKAPRQAPGGGRARVAMRKVVGAPGDGNTSLATSLAALLKHQDIELVDAAKGRPDIDISGDVSLSPAPDGKQHVKIVWHVVHAGGGEIGQVAQENDIPRGRLDGAWGDVAYSVAMAAQGGIMQLVDRGVPPPKPSAAAAAVPPAGRDATLPAAAPTGPPPVAGNIAAPEVNLPPVNVGPEPMPKPLPAPDVPVILPYRGIPLPPQ